MPSENISIKTFIEKFDNGEFSSSSVDVQCAAGWYDWFCRDTSLVGKTAKLAQRLKSIANSPKINIENHRVWFKNNCPCSGSLYDDFRIADMETGVVVYCIVPKSGHTGKSEVWGKENEFLEPLISGKWFDAKQFFKS
jgi:hypothetical protein